MNISLPGSMKAFVDQQTAEGGYETASEYVRHLLREEKKRRLREQIDTKLLDGLASGEPAEATARLWQDLKRKARRRSATKKSR